MKRIEDYSTPADPELAALVREALDAYDALNDEDDALEDELLTGTEVYGKFGEAIKREAAELLKSLRSDRSDGEHNG